MTTESHAVLCGQCHRTMVVAVSNLHPPCFRNVEEQADCPEILQRRGSGDETLLTMMCGALAGSLAENLERAAIEVADREGVWQVACRIPGDANRHYSPAQARGQAEIWERCGRTGLALRFRDAAKEADRRAFRSRRRMRGLAPILALSAVVAVAGAGWLMFMPQPSEIAMQSRALAADRSAPAAAETAAKTRRLLAAAPASAQVAVPETAAPPPPEAVPSTPPAASIPAANQPASAAAQKRQLLAAASPSAQVAVSETPPAPSPEAVPSTPEAKSTPAAQVLASAASATIDAASTSRAAPLPEPAAEPVAEPEMVSLPGGKFPMGSTLDSSEAPIHTVSIKPFAISKFPVTIRAWNQCVAAKACSYLPADEDGDAPVTNVSYNDAQQFIAWLDQATQKKFRLPSEAEWEYAAHGGTRTKYWWGDDMQPGMVNCKGCNVDQTARQTVKDVKPNPFGLYDMGGGLAQWVSDCWHKNYQGAVADGSAWLDADYCVFHVIRSGSWRNDPSYVRPTSRSFYDGRIRYPTHGFRIARSL
jgi:formylglycine-generating enzyme required for sulfatase activity